MSQQSTGDGSAYEDDDPGSAAANSQEDENSSVEEVTGLENGYNQPANPASTNDPAKGKRLSRKLLESRDAYRDLFNSTIYDATGQQALQSDRILEPPSQIGASIWTSSEKEIFFRNLPILGRHNIKELSAATGTKSEAEVHQYLELLSEGVIEGTLTQNLDGLVATNIPAAWEIRSDCEAVLEAAADVLASEQLEYESKRETKRFGDYWLLDEEVALEVEAILKAVHESASPHDTQTIDEGAHIQENGGVSAPLDLPVPAAELLNLPNWLEVSKLFMWQAEGGSENWVNYTTSEIDAPSMYHTAFQDFHNLTVSLTRRLLQATIFQAESRLRAQDRESPTRAVYAADVHTAANILNLKSDKKQFWAKLPRQHGLKVHLRVKKDKRQSAVSESEAEDNQHGSTLRLSYEEVESKLGIADQDEVQATEEALETVEDASEIIQAHDDSDMWTEVSVNSEDARSPADSGESSSDGDGRYQPEDEQSEVEGPRILGKRAQMWTAMKKHDLQIDAFDRDASAVEEARLWTLFDLPAPLHIKEENNMETNAFLVKRKTKGEMRDWRHHIDFEAEWESNDGIVDSEEFAAMQGRGVAACKRRKLMEEELTRGFRRSNRPARGSLNVQESSDEEQDDALSQPQPPPPVEHFGIVWSATAAGEMQPIPTVEVNYEQHDAMDGTIVDTQLPHATLEEDSSPGVSRRAQTAHVQDEQETNDFAIHRHASMPVAPPPALGQVSSSTARRVPEPGNVSYQLRRSRARKPTASIPRSTPSLTKAPPASAFLDRLTRERRSTSFTGAQSNASRQPSAHALSPANENLAASVSEDGSNSGDSEEVGPIAKPAPPLAPDLDSDAEAPNGWLASLKRRKSSSSPVQQKKRARLDR